MFFGSPGPPRLAPRVPKEVVFAGYFCTRFMENLWVSIKTMIFREPLVKNQFFDRFLVNYVRNQKSTFLKRRVLQIASNRGQKGASWNCSFLKIMIFIEPLTKNQLSRTFLDLFFASALRSTTSAKSLKNKGLLSKKHFPKRLKKYFLGPPGLGYFLQLALKISLGPPLASKSSQHGSRQAPNGAENIKK